MSIDVDLYGLLCLTLFSYYRGSLSPALGYQPTEPDLLLLSPAYQASQSPPLFPYEHNSAQTRAAFRRRGPRHNGLGQQES